VTGTSDALLDLRARIPPLVRFGTSSWNYPGWQGLVYHRKYPASGAVARMLGEYARYPLFSTVGIDSSYYRPLTAATWGSYAAQLPADFQCVSKAWLRVTVHTFTGHQDGGTAGQANPDFLNADLCINEVIGPALQGGGAHVGPLVFEFQAISRKAGITPTRFAELLDAFLGRLPPECRYGVELRNPEYYTDAYRAVLREHGASHVFNSWTRMPSIGEQLAAPDAVTAGFLVSRALLRPGRLYEDAVDAFAPYDRIQDENLEARGDLLALIRTALQARVPVFVIINNRLEGSAPLTIEALARALVQAGG
jgi:uncharacterized protein YecE (DUF72 family)